MTTKIHLLMKAPKKCYLAFSGGVDSMVLLDVLLKRGADVTLLTVDHGNDFAKLEVDFCKDTAYSHVLQYEIHTIPERNPKDSLEAHWSVERNKIFKSKQLPVLTAHHMGDSVSWFIMSSMQGQSKILCPVNDNILRPLLGTTKESIIEYANKHNLTYLSDPTNLDPKFGLRNKVNIELLPHIKNCFPGIETTVRKLTLKKLKEHNEKDLH